MDQASPALVSAAPSPALAGVWAAIFTPFRVDGTLDLNAAARNARAYCRDFDLDGVFCNGIMGEGWSLTLDERQAVLEAILDAVGGAGGALRVGVVVTHHAAGETLLLARHAGAVGADHVVLMRPRGPWTDAELADLGAAASDAAGLPLTLFESTAPGMGFGPGVIARLAEAGRVHAIKATGGAKAVAELRRRFPDLEICDPHEDQWLTTLLARGDRPLYADPEPYLYRVGATDHVRGYRMAALAGDHVVAAEAWRRLAPLRALYDAWIIGPLDQGRSPAAALKHWAARRGLATGPVRFPLRPLSTQERERLTRELDAADALVADGGRTP